VSRTTVDCGGALTTLWCPFAQSDAGARNCHRSGHIRSSLSTRMLVIGLLVSHPRNARILPAGCLAKREVAAVDPNCAVAHRA